MPKQITKVWAVFHDRVGYQVYRQSSTNPIFYYSPHNIRWLGKSLGELMGEYDNEEQALSAKTLAEEIETLNRGPYLEAAREYFRLKFELEDKIRNGIKELGGQIVISQ